jgi:uncharacterized damage-inducible protein DinB
MRYDRAEFPDVAEVRRAWEAVAAQTEAFLADLTEEELATVFERTSRDGRVFAQPLWVMMLHVANHGTQHRAEAAGMASAAGFSPGDLDLVFYMAASA